MAKIVDTGYTCKIDAMGIISRLPKDINSMIGILPEDEMKVFVDMENKEIVLKKISPTNYNRT